MGKEWDRAVPSTFQWEQCYRVLKDGAFMFIQSAPRLDLLGEMERRIRAAGFLTSFTPIYWSFSTGFPKAHNISLELDRYACRLELEKELGRKPSFNEFQERWKDFRIEVGRTDGYRENAVEAHTEGQPGHFGLKTDGSGLVTEPRTEEAKRFQGAYGGFQPKPAVEVILVCQKPMSEKTFRDQVLKNGKGVVWFDDGRIPYQSNDNTYEEGIARAGQPRSDIKSASFHSNNEKESIISTTNMSPKGRFPANLLSQDNVLDDGSKRKSSELLSRHKRDYNESGKSFQIRDRTGEPITVPDDIGSYNRYFDLDFWFSEHIQKLPLEVQRVFPFLIVPKPSSAEKEKGLEEFDRKQRDLGRKEGNVGSDNPFNRGVKKKLNDHATVKPIQLYSYLIMIGSREKDIVLDPFCGSGTTCIAAKTNFRKYIGIEMEERSYNIATARIDAVQTIIEHDFW